MANDNNSELLALMGDLIRATDRQTESFNQRFEVFDQRLERLNQVMVDGFGRLEEKISGTYDRLDHLTRRVDHVAGRVDHLTVEVAEIKVQAQETNRRLGNVFEHAGQLTETTQATRLRLSYVEG